MAETYEEVQETITRKKLIAVTCDRCGRDLTKRDSSTSYNTVSFELKAEWGNSWPGCGNGDGFVVDDLCYACIQVLRELLHSNGFAVRDTDWDY